MYGSKKNPKSGLIGDNMKIKGTSFLPFLNARNYIHSTQMLELCGQIMNEHSFQPQCLSATFFRPLSKTIQWTLTEGEDAPVGEAVFRLKAKKREAILVFRNGHEAVTERLFHDEEFLMTKAVYEPEHMQIVLDAVQTPFAASVALGKALAIRVTGQSRKWLVAQYEMSHPFLPSPRGFAMEVRLRNRVGGAMLRVDIRLNGEVRGFIVYRRIVQQLDAL